MQASLHLLKALGDYIERCPQVSMLQSLKVVQNGLSVWIVDSESQFSSKVRSFGSRMIHVTNVCRLRILRSWQISIRSRLSRIPGGKFVQRSSLFLNMVRIFSIVSLHLSPVVLRALASPWPRLALKPGTLLLVNRSSSNTLGGLRKPFRSYDQSRIYNYQPSLMIWRLMYVSTLAVMELVILT